MKHITTPTLKLRLWGSASASFRDLVPEDLPRLTISMLAQRLGRPNLPLLSAEWITEAKTNSGLFPISN